MSQAITDEQVVALLRVVNHYVNGTAWNWIFWRRLVSAAGYSAAFPPSNVAAHVLQDLLGGLENQPGELDFGVVYETDMNNISEFEMTRYSNNQRVRKLMFSLSQPWPSSMKSLYVHGSLADGTAIGYSDVDLVMIIDATPSAGQLRRLRLRALQCMQAVLRFQPDQHHGTLVIPVSIADRLPSHILPPAVAKSLRRVTDRAPSARLIILANGRQVERAVNVARQICNVRQPSSSYEAMMLLSQVMLLPTLEQGALGRQLSKRRALGVWTRAGGVKGEVVKMATAARQAWPDPEAEHWSHFMFRPINPWMVSAIRRRVGPSPPEPVLPFISGDALSKYQRVASLVLKQIETRSC